MALRVALVDDHRLMREGVKGFLTQRGVEIVGEGSSGRDGVRLARELRPDVLLMDLSMPEMNGLEATRLIQAERPEQIVVILTASESEADLFEAVKSGAQGYLLKNIDPEQLVSQLEAAARGEAALTPALAAKILHELARTATGRGASGEQGVDTGPATSACLSAGEAASFGPGAATQGREAGGPAASTGPGRGGPLPTPRSSPSIAPDEVEPLTSREREVLELVVRGASNKEIADALIVTDNTVKYHLKNIFQKLHLKNRAQVVAYALQHGLDAPGQDGGGGAR